jgi:hypothetical protein
MVLAAFSLCKTLTARWAKTWFWAQNQKLLDTRQNGWVPFILGMKSRIARCYMWLKYSLLSEILASSGTLNYCEYFHQMFEMKPFIFLLKP